MKLERKSVSVKEHSLEFFLDFPLSSGVLVFFCSSHFCLSFCLYASTEKVQKFR